MKKAIIIYLEGKPLELKSKYIFSLRTKIKNGKTNKKRTFINLDLKPFKCNSKWEAKILFWPYTKSCWKLSLVSFFPAESEYNKSFYYYKKLVAACAREHPMRSTCFTCGRTYRVKRRFLLLEWWNQLCIIECCSGIKDNVF